MFEQIPQATTITLYYLQYPGLILSLYNYIYVIILSSNKNPALSVDYNHTYVLSHYIFHGFYFLFFLKEWNVVHQARYLRLVKRPIVAFFIVTHVYLFSLLHHETFLVGPILSFYMGFYWHLHIKFLQLINDSLVEE